MKNSTKFDSQKRQSNFSLSRASLYILLCFVFALPFSVRAQSTEASDHLKSFLENRSFLELIAKYKQEHITLRAEGKKAGQIAARPYRIGKGYRCQAFAGASLANAQQVAARLRSLDFDSVYVFKSERGLYKVQIGDFDNREGAVELLDRLRNAGIKNAWIVESDIRIAKSPEEKGAFEDQKNSRQQQFDLEQEFFYAIQVFATGDSLKALKLREVFQTETQNPAEVVREDSIWKVLIGRFKQRSEAEQLLKSLKRRRFVDAWITQVPAT